MREVPFTIMLPLYWYTPSAAFILEEEL